MEIQINKMEPGVIYYGVQGSCTTLFKVAKIFTTEQAALEYIEELVKKYNPIYQKMDRISVGNVNSVRAFICKHIAMVE
jgi:hypothetical protein